MLTRAQVKSVTEHDPEAAQRAVSALPTQHAAPPSPAERARALGLAMRGCRSLGDGRRWQASGSLPRHGVGFVLHGDTAGDALRAVIAAAEGYIGATIIDVDAETSPHATSTAEGGAA